MTITKEAKVFDIGTVPLIGEFELIAIPTLIEVQTIKKKIVEQMSETPLKMLRDHGSDVFRIVGRVGPWIVIHSDSHQFTKIHRNDWMDYVQTVLIQEAPAHKTPDVKTLSKEAYKRFYGLPQMFES